MPSQTATRVHGGTASVEKEELAIASNVVGLFLCPFYPPQDPVASHYGVVHILKQLS